MSPCETGDKKTRYMSCLSKWLKDLNEQCFKLGDVSIDNVQEHKYLGVIIDNILTDDASIKTQMKGFYARGNMLYKYFSKCSPEVKAQLIKTYCCNLYCSSPWTPYN